MVYRDFRIYMLDRRNVMGYGLDDLPMRGKICMDTLREQTIEVFSHWLTENKMKQREEFSVLGSHLYEALFGDVNSAIRRVFEEEFRNSQRQRPFAPLRLVLNFSREARELAELPWEYLYYPDGQERGFFIAAHAEIILARHVPINIDLDDLLKNIDKGPLRILIVVSKPEYEDVQGEDEQPGRMLGSIDAEHVTTTIKGIHAIETSILDQPTKNSLIKRISAFRPHVVHFIAHGRYKDQKGELALVNENDQLLADWIDDAGLADCFMEYKPGLIFLHACEGAHSDSYKSFKGLALQLIYSKIPAVVAMQYAVQNDIADHFAITFYQSLSKGKAIDVAVQDGRRELGSCCRPSYSDRSFGCPVIYLPSHRAEIVLVEAQEQQEQSRTQLPTLGNCPSCGAQNVLTNKYCWNCDLPLITCPYCSSLVIKKDKPHCVICGRMVELRTVGAKIGARESILTYATKPETVNSRAVKPEEPTNVGVGTDTLASALTEYHG